MNGRGCRRSRLIDWEELCLNPVSDRSKIGVGPCGSAEPALEALEAERATLQEPLAVLRLDAERGRSRSGAIAFFFSRFECGESRPKQPRMLFGPLHQPREKLIPLERIDAKILRRVSDVIRDEVIVQRRHLPREQLIDASGHRI